MDGEFAVSSSMFEVVRLVSFEKPINNSQTMPTTLLIISSCLNNENIQSVSELICQGWLLV